MAARLVSCHPALRIDLPDRKIRPHSKARTGCQNCKSRRIKCDEQKPNCDRCFAKGLACEYIPIKTWLFESSKQCSKDENARDALSPSSVGYFHYVSDRQFQFFVEVTAPLLSSYHVEMGLRVYKGPRQIDGMISSAITFYTVHLPQVMQSSPVLRYAISACSTCHESVEMIKEPAWRNSSFAKNYTKALQYMTDPKSDIPIEHVLVSCLSFASVEFMHGHAFEGVKHILSGAKIIQQYEAATETDENTLCLLRECFWPVFAVYLGFAGQAVDRKSDDTYNDQNDLTETSALKSLSSLGQGRRQLFQIAEVIVYLSCEKPKEHSFHLLQTRTALLQWSSAYYAWKAARLKSSSREARRTETLLEIYAKILAIHSSTSDSGESTYDYFSDDFRTIVCLLGSIASSYPLETDTRVAKDHTLLYNLGIIYPLFFVALNCRHRKVRESALELLRNINLNEGSWNSCVAYAIANEVKSIEEESARSLLATDGRIKYVPIRARVRLQGITSVLSPTPSISLEYYDTQTDSVRTKSLARIPCQWNSDHASPQQSKIIRRGGYQGVLRTIPGCCTCHGAGVEPDSFKSESPGSLILGGRLPSMSRCLAGREVATIKPHLRATQDVIGLEMCE